MKKATLLLSIASLLHCFIAGKPAFAAGEFTSAYNVTYTVAESGLTTVTYDISLTNQTIQYFATEYTLTQSLGKVANVSAFDRLGKIKTEVREVEKGTEIHLFFNEKVVGLGNSLNFTLSFQTPEIAQKVGRIWEVNLPKGSDDTAISTYNANLLVPASFPPLAYASPPSQKVTPRGKGQEFFWTKKEINDGASLAFGDYQVFDFKLNYHLKNPKPYPVYTEIALPPDTQYQRISFSQIRPRPTNVSLDPDDNWLARFNLSPGQKINVEVLGQAQIFFEPKFFLKTPDKAALARYLAPKPYWETSSQIETLADRLKTPRAIYDFVVKTLKYDYQKVEKGGPRLGAQKALDNPNSAICMEFTDLFVALARAAGIPAREINGFAYTTNPRLRPLSLEKDILHAWPEYFDFEKNTWVMIDPTWGATTGGLDYFQKLDFNHFVFVRKGVDSEKPAPAGAYKLDSQGGKDVEVNPGEDFFALSPQIQLEFNLAAKFLAGTSPAGKVKIKNKSGVALYNQTLTLFSSPLSLLDSEVFFGVIPPFSESSSDLRFAKTKMFDRWETRLQGRINDQSFETTFKVSPFIPKGWLILLGGGFLALTLILAFKARRLPFQK